MYSFNKNHTPTGFDPITQHLGKRHIEPYGVRVYKTALRKMEVHE